MEPLRYEQLLLGAARRGYYVMGLAYPTVGIEPACTTDPSCYENARLEVYEGIDHTGAVTVGKSDCIHGRLLVLIDFFVEWKAQLLDSTTDDVKWSVVTIAGHGEGGAHAAFIARDNKVARAAMISAPSDEGAGEPVPWVKASHVTPPDRYFGLSHTSESAHGAHLRAWTALGVPGENVFSTSLDPASSKATTDPAHASTGIDGYTPIGGSPSITELWARVLGP